MAILQSWHQRFHARGNTRVELIPNSPAQRNLVDTYQLRLWIHEQLVYDRVHSVCDWQMRHYYVEQIARMCCSVNSYIDKHIESTDPNDFLNDKFLSPVFAKVDTDWLSVTASAATTKRHGITVVLELSLVQAEHRIGDVERRSAGQWGEWQERITAIVLCKPEDADHFGRQLLDEIAEVERQRITLGIPEYDDDSPYQEPTA